MANCVKYKEDIRWDEGRCGAGNMNSQGIKTKVTGDEVRRGRGGGRTNTKKQGKYIKKLSCGIEKEGGLSKTSGRSSSSRERGKIVYQKITKKVPYHPMYGDPRVLSLREGGPPPNRNPLPTWDRKKPKGEEKVRQNNKSSEGPGGESGSKNRENKTQKTKKEPKSVGTGTGKREPSI